MSFDKKLTLIRFTPSEGRAKPAEVSRKTVWAEISEPGVVTKLTALSAGQRVELSAVMWRREFDGFTHAEYGGKTYKIVQTGAAKSDLHIKLLLERG